VNAHTIVCGRSAITNRVRASVWAFTHALANVDLAVETLFSITPVLGEITINVSEQIFVVEFKQGGAAAAAPTRVKAAAAAAAALIASAAPAPTAAPAPPTITVGC